MNVKPINGVVRAWSGPPQPRAGEATYTIAATLPSGATTMSGQRTGLSIWPDSIEIDAQRLVGKSVPGLLVADYTLVWLFIEPPVVVECGDVIEPPPPPAPLPPPTNYAGGIVDDATYEPPAVPPTLEPAPTPPAESEPIGTGPSDLTLFEPDRKKKPETIDPLAPLAVQPPQPIVPQPIEPRYTPPSQPIASEPLGDSSPLPDIAAPSASAPPPSSTPGGGEE